MNIVIENTYVKSYFQKLIKFNITIFYRHNSRYIVVDITTGFPCQWNIVKTVFTLFQNQSGRALQFGENLPRRAPNKHLRCGIFVVECVRDTLFVEYSDSTSLEQKFQDILCILAV